jgi:hypothetical protein
MIDEASLAFLEHFRFHFLKLSFKYFAVEIDEGDFVNHAKVWHILFMGIEVFQFFEVSFLWYLLIVYYQLSLVKFYQSFLLLNLSGENQAISIKNTVLSLAICHLLSVARL